MASRISKGESLYIPFRGGYSISDSQLKPRMYKSVDAFRKSFPGHYLGTKDVELVEYTPVVRGHWKYGTRGAVCSVCGFERHLDDNFGAAISCPNCSAKMDGDVNDQSDNLL